MGNALEKLKKECDDKKAELQQARQEVDLMEAKRQIKLLRAEVLDLEKEEERLKDERAGLEEQQSTVQQIEYLEQDIRGKTEKRKKILTKRNSTLLDLFQTIPDLKRLKSVFKDEQEKNESKVKEIDAAQQKDETAIALRSNQILQIKKDCEKKN